MNIIYFLILSSRIFSIIQCYGDKPEGNTGAFKRKKKVSFGENQEFIVPRTESEKIVLQNNQLLDDDQRFNLERLNTEDQNEGSDFPQTQSYFPQTQNMAAAKKPRMSKKPSMLGRIASTAAGKFFSKGKSNINAQLEENVKKVISFKDATEAFNKLKARLKRTAGDGSPVQDYLKTVDNYLENAFLPDRLKNVTGNYQHKSKMNLETALRNAREPSLQTNTHDLRDYLDVCSLYSVRSIQDEVVETGIVQKEVIDKKRITYMDTLLNSFKVLSGYTQIALIYPLFGLYKAFENQNYEKLIQQLNAVTFSPYWDRIKAETSPLTTFMFELYVKKNREVPMQMKDEFRSRADTFCSKLMQVYTSSDEKKKFRKLLNSITDGATKKFLDVAQKYNSNYMYNSFPVFNLEDTSENDDQFRKTAVEILRMHFKSVLRIYSQFISIIFQVTNYKAAGFQTEAEYFNCILDEFMVILNYARSFEAYSVFLKDTSVIPMEQFILNIQMLTFQLRSYLAQFITEFEPEGDKKPDAHFYDSKLSEYKRNRYTAIHYIMVQNETNRHKYPYWKDFTQLSSGNTIFEKPIDLKTLAIKNNENNFQDKLNLLQLERMTLVTFMKSLTSIRAVKEPKNITIRSINDLKFGILFRVQTHADMEDLSPKYPSHFSP